MGKGFNKKERLDILSSILGRVDDQLKYAETKNGVLLTLNLVAIGVAVRLDVNNDSWISVLSWTIGVLSCLAALIMVLITFSPKLGRWYDKAQGDLEEVGSGEEEIFSGNLFFFEHLGGISAERLCKVLAYELGGGEEDLSRLERNVIYQIAAVSKIAGRKFCAFPPAMAVFLIGLVCITFGLINK